jgi:hypothetical protein
MQRQYAVIACVFSVLALLAAGCTVGMGTDLPDVTVVGDVGPRIDGSRPDAPARDAARPDGGTGPCGSELCNNGLDDDCDGVVENGCGCLPGETASCFAGPATSRGVGACVSGTMTCTDGEEFGEWGDCVGDVLPAEETCDAGSVDEDCDGAVNEGCECMDTDPPVACGSDVGACVAGAQTCTGGMLGACTGAVGPATETCNGVDDDCDGSTDEGITRPCGTDTGECSTGVETCVMGAFDTCTGGRRPGVEDCNGLDDDCDGSMDEMLTRACGSSVGACRPGMQTCSAGTWGTCGGETLPGLESCNNVDDDCDGRTDESISRPCGSSVGICRPGTETCTAGRYGACTGGTGPGTEMCDGRLDENCNGTVDEGCGCTTGTMRVCGTDVGDCAFGSQTCTSSGTWAPCMGGVGPTVEICDMSDDDCDASTDEGGVCPTAPPTATCGAAVTARVLSTVTVSGSGADPDGGTVTYRWTVTSRPAGSASVPASPTSPSTTFFLDAAGSYTLQLCITDDEMQTSCCNVSVTSTPPPGLHVEVQWSTVYGDVDSHLLDVTRVPDDGWFTSSDCYFANRTPDWGPVGAAANPTLDRDDTDGYGPENTTITTSPASGRYHVGIHYYCDHSIGSGMIGMGSGPTDATVRVYCDGALIATYTGLTLSETDDWMTVASVDYPSCVGRSISRRTNGTSILPASFTAPRHCEIPCSTAADCPSGERCVRAGGGGPPRNICWL